MFMSVDLLACVIVSVYVSKDRKGLACVSAYLHSVV